MRKISFSFSLFFLLGGALFFCFNLLAGLSHTHNPRLKTVADMQLPQKPFVILITAFNPGKAVEKCLASVLEQNYKNFRVIYLDDASSDNSLQFVQQFIEKEGFKEKAQIKTRDKSIGKIASLYKTFSEIADKEIILFLDGKDWLAHDEVLLLLNHCYGDLGVWMTYGSHLTYPLYKRTKATKEVPQAVHQSSNYRDYLKTHFLNWHPLTCYGSLAKRIQEKDLMKSDQFIRSESFFPFALPLLEMSTSHALYIKDVLYLHNLHAPLRRSRSERESREYLRTLPAYESIQINS